eukprot:9229552-Lingulodinium_polyedra.AAC.1
MGDGLTEAERQQLQYLVVHAGRRKALHVVQLYGWADGRAAAADNARLLLCAVSWVRSLGDVPALIVGDLNCTLEGTGIEGILSMAGWTELLGDAGPTCVPSASNPSRIDFVLASRSAKAWVRSAR